MLRIGLFLLTNIAVVALLMLVVTIASKVFGIDLRTHTQGGLNYAGLATMALVWGFAGSLISLFLSKFMAIKGMGVQVIKTPATATERWLVDTVARQAAAVKIGMPDVGIFDSLQPNAFASGWNKNNAIVAVSTGLLHTMNEKEVEAVLAHEIGHVANGDMVTMTLLQGVVNAFVIFFARIIGTIVDQTIFKNESDSPGLGYYITSFVMDILLGFLASAIVMWFSRYREFRADEMGARLAGKDSMIAALNALRPATQRPDAMPENMAALGIASGKREGFSIAHIFASHPSLDKRIASLQAYNPRKA